MSERIPEVVSTGALDCMGQRIVIHVLDDGRRIIDKGSLADYLALTGRCDESMRARIRDFMRGTGIPEDARATPAGGTEP